MLWLSTSTLSRLRDQLRERGAAPSQVFPPGSTPESIEAINISTEYGPLCEAMYLMMSADNDVSDAEREVLKGALRNLSGDTLRSKHIEVLLDDAIAKIKDEGREKRMAAVVDSLKGDAGRAEVAFVLAAAIAFADNAIADEENDTLNAFAEGLGISDERAEALMDDVDADLAEHPENVKKTDDAVTPTEGESGASGAT
ncbi:MAG: TerB family tellurite resistance protein [Polyangiaceae bacterium]